MKSSPEILSTRGYIDDSTVKKFRKLDINELIYMVFDDFPSNRSAAVRVLTEKKAYNRKDVVICLLERLSLEEALYCKIEICKALEKGDRETAWMMCRYLGEIGNNQHHEIPEKSSLKKSFPLPRDIIARTLGRMDPQILPLLLDQLLNGEDVLSELLDAIGYMVYNHPELATTENLDRIKESQIFSGKQQTNQINMWKMVRCLSVFPLKESIDLLEELKKNRKTPTSYRK